MGHRSTVDLNADLGESPAADGVDQALLSIVTTAHVACGFHAGGPGAMRRTVALAVEHGVAVGAHPSYPDEAGFGRRAMDVPPAAVADDVLYQLGALQALARAEGAVVRSVKPHGALYHRMAVDVACTAAVAAALAGLGGSLALVLPAGSPVLAVAAAAGVEPLAEGFCDRQYQSDGSLVPRERPGALVVDPPAAVARAVSLVTGRRIGTVDGTGIDLEVDTLCVHGDTPGAVVIARRVRLALEAAGVTVASATGW